MSNIEIILLIASLAFIVLVIYLIKLIRASCRTLKKVNRATESLQRQLDDLGHRPRDLLQHANEISANLHGKMKRLDGYFKSASDFGRQPSFYSRKNHEEGVTDFVELALLGLNLWQKAKGRR